MFKNRFERASRITKVAAIRAKNELSAAMELEQSAIGKGTMIRKSILQEVEVAQRENSHAMTIRSYMEWIHRAQHEHDKNAEICRFACSETKFRKSIFIEARKSEEMINILKRKQICNNSKITDK
jgi:hypothetical protein